MREPSSEAETAASIARALCRMPRRRREILLAVRLEGASYGELALRHQLTIVEVEREVATGIDAVAEALDGCRPDSRWQRLVRWLRVTRSK